jgi:hypothetical protein
MTHHGIAQIENIVIFMVNSGFTPSMILAGVGERFLAIYETLKSGFCGVSVKYSPLLGTADVTDEDGLTYIETGKVKAEQYVGIINTQGFDPWEFLKSLPNKTVICTGNDFLIALGLKIYCEEGVLIEVNVEIHSASLVYMQEI